MHVRQRKGMDMATPQDNNMPLATVAESLVEGHPDSAGLLAALSAYRSACGKAAFQVVVSDMADMYS